MKYLATLIFCLLCLSVSAQMTATLDDIYNCENKYVIVVVAAGAGGNTILSISANIKNEGITYPIIKKSSIRTPQQLLNAMDEKGWEYMESWGEKDSSRKYLFRKKKEGENE